MSNEKLSELDNAIAKLQAKRQALFDRRKAEKLSEVVAAIQEFGFTASELGLKGKGKSAKLKTQGRYTNPGDKAQTWAGGRGPRPKWVKDHLARGGKLEDLEINKRK